MMKMIEDKARFEDLVFAGTYESIHEANDLIQTYLPQQRWLQYFINFVASHRPFAFKDLAELFNKTGKTKIKFTQLKVFPSYLFVKNILTKEDFFERAPPANENLKTVKEYERPIDQNALAILIQSDDVTEFVSFITLHQIDLETQCIDINGWSFTLKWFVCYCGSLKILKYLLINNIEIDQWSIVKAVQGGSEACIQFLISQGYSFDGTLRHAIEYHQNKIAEWLYDNYEDPDFTLPFCVENFNTHMLLYFIKQHNWNINEQDSTRKTALHWASKKCDYALFDFLLFKGADKTIKEWYG